MATIQIADKPTLDAVLAKVNKMYGYTGYKESRLITTNVTCPKGQVTDVFNVESDTGGMVKVINGGNYGDTSLIIDDAVVMTGNMNAIFNNAINASMYFAKKFKIQIDNKTSVDHIGVALKFLVYI